MIRFDQEGDLWIATIDRQEKANSLTEEMLTQLAEFAESATAAKVFVITGAGKVFSAGADLDEARAGLATSPVWERLSGAIAALPCMTIAALNGTLAGGAFGMALACDLRISVPTAKFFYPVMKLGFLPQPSDPKRMAALLGPSRAKLILMGGQKITADEALSFGLVDRLVEVDNLMSMVREIATDALEAKPSHIAGIKGLVG
ncbi:enoyl-CoA hydratase/isomerase family protein [Marivivens donghaensis]|uniref:enoyl-CoA hydratase/isomerase family protein n=1 Tax=Marivivens donghaensis TaxID=1699413 RepID=UPI00201EADCE|nr:enoyl-CoA hydratase/isomerase family protein [Marivivens donghaensis]MCL7409469.1 enoyl-CoA hydratase/isomerase family protein [Marivivens donghaensis]MDN3702948.1 enoyl-CoA hydratase/isomerase family protein [Marivivens donghaensis]